MTSVRLCVGIFVAIPTAMPTEPFTRRFGNFVGRTDGSRRLLSKFGTQSTTSLPMSAISSSEIFDILASVYLYAAAPSPSIEPKFPWP